MAGTGIGLADFTDPTITPSLIASLKSSPEVMKLLTSGGSGQVDVDGAEYTITNGRVTDMHTGGSVWPYLALAASGAAGGYAAGALAGGAGGAAGGATGSAYVGADVASTAAATEAGITAGNVGLTAAGGLGYAGLAKSVLPVAGQIVSGLIQSNAQGNASAAQLALQQQALDYEKANDLYNRGLAATALTTANQRYGDYQGRIAPFVANGTNANDRMAALLGLPAGSGSSGGSSSGGPSRGSSGSQGVPLTPDITKQLADNYAALGYTPTGDGSGATDINYYGKQVAANGGLSAEGQAYWLGPNGRIAQDLTRTGAVRSAPITAGASPSTTASPSAPITPAPATSGASVQMRGPDGSVKSVNSADVAHYQALGATLIGAAA